MVAPLLSAKLEFGWSVADYYGELLSGIQKSLIALWHNYTYIHNANSCFHPHQVLPCAGTNVLAVCTLRKTKSLKLPIAD